MNDKQLNLFMVMLTLFSAFSIFMFSKNAVMQQNPNRVSFSELFEFTDWFYHKYDAKDITVMLAIGIIKWRLILVGNYFYKQAFINTEENDKT